MSRKEEQTEKEKNTKKRNVKRKRRLGVRKSEESIKRYINIIKKDKTQKIKDRSETTKGKRVNKSIIHSK